MPSIVAQTPSSPLVEFSVEYYDAEHKQKLSNYPSVQAIESLVTTGLAVEEIEIVTMTLFREQKVHPGFRGYHDLKKYAPGEIGKFRRYFDISSGTIRAIFDGNNTPTECIDGVGVAGALLAMNKIFGLHEADWEKLKVGSVKDLDYMYPSTGLLASTGTQFIEVEAKGSVVRSAEMKGEVSNAMGDIRRKKEVQRSRGNNNELFGVITSIPTGSNEKARCRLLDPPAQPVGMNAGKYKLLARLTYYLGSISRFSQLRMLTALSNRIRAISRVDDYAALNELPLVDARGEPFRFHPSLEQYKTTSKNDKVVGRVFPISQDEYFFYGFDVAIFDLVAEQNFESIVAFRSSLEGSHELDMDALLDGNDLEQFDIVPQTRGYRPYDKSNRWWTAKLRGRIVITGSGRATGTLRDEASSGSDLLRQAENAATSQAQPLLEPPRLSMGEHLNAFRGNLPIPTLSGD